MGRKFDRKKHWAFVSVVRDVGQIEMFDNVLESVERTLDAFVHLLLQRRQQWKDSH